MNEQEYTNLKLSISEDAINGLNEPYTKVSMRLACMNAIDGYRKFAKRGKQE